MGLDQYMYAALAAGQQEAYYNSWDGENYNESLKPRELAYRRKHPHLQGWMEQLYLRKNPNIEINSGYAFNGVELELTWDDLEELEQDLKEGRLPETQGFFFGGDSSDYYLPQDLEFVKQAKAEIFCGFKVFYNSSW